MPSRRICSGSHMYRRSFLSNGICVSERDSMLDQKDDDLGDPGEGKRTPQAASWPRNKQNPNPKVPTYVSAYATDEDTDTECPSNSEFVGFSDSIRGSAMKGLDHVFR